MNKIIALVVCILLSASNILLAEDYNEINWQSGPSKYTIANKAKLFVPEKYFFLDAIETDKFLKLSHNFPTGKDYLFAPREGWESYFSFESLGYVKDDNEIDGDEILEEMYKNQKYSNEERKKKGWDQLYLQGWQFAPRYDSRNNLLEWALLIKDENNKSIINYETRILGRNGVMNVVLVATPENLSSAVADFKKKIKGFEFLPGERYSEYKEGDRVAEFGLAALITGGVAALASKKGVWAAIVGFFVAFKKIAVAVVIGIFAWLWSLFRKKK